LPKKNLTMKNSISVFLLSLIVWGCNSGNNQAGHNSNTAADSLSSAATEQDSTAAPQETSSASLIDSLHFGMKAEEVVALLGEPTKRETIGKDPKIPAEDWWYGENQKVRIINGEVNRVVKDVAHEQELLKQLVEAKKKNDDAEMQRIMEELTKGHH